MRRWTRAEAGRTLDEVKRRSLSDPEFRALALSDAKAAVSKVNPKVLPSGFRIVFVPAGTSIEAGEPGTLTVMLPGLIAQTDDLSDTELEQAVGGTADINFPAEWVLPE